MDERGNDKWNSDEPMPWPEDYFGVKVDGMNRSSAADPQRPYDYIVKSPIERAD